MISDSTYEAIWDGLLEVCRYRRYAILCERKYRRLANTFRFALAISGIGTLASLVEIFEFLPAESISIFGTLISVFIVADLIFNPSKVAAQLTIINSKLSNFEGEYREIWEKTRANLIDDSEALERKSQLMQEIDDVCSLVDISVNDKYSEIAQTEAFQTEEARYAS